MSVPPRFRPSVKTLGVSSAALDKLRDILKNRYFTTIINFDDVPDGTIINSSYTAKGVTFSAITTNPPSSGGSVYARSAYDAETPSNVVTLISSAQSAWFTFFDAYNGGIEAKFTSPVNTVSIDTKAILGAENLGHEDNRPFMEVFDTNGAKIAEIRYPYRYDQAGFGTWQRLTYTSSQRNIGSIRFSSQRVGSNYVYAMFDTLIFTVDILFH